MGSTTAATRLKVRKGTHSCRECRRRKLKCIFSASDSRQDPQKSAVCDSCRLRGLRCLSQASNTAIKDFRGSARILAAKELEEHPTPVNRQTQVQDLLSCSVADGGRVAVVLGQNSGMDASFSNVIFGASLAHRISLLNHHASASSHLCSLLPEESTISILLENGPSALLVPSRSSSDSQQHVKATDHPAVISRLLMMLALCLQQLPSSFDQSSLVFPKALTLRKDSSGNSSSSVIRAWLDAVTLVLDCNDDLIANVEGLETLILKSIVYADAGYLRKAWMIGRKVISLAIMLGLSNPQPSTATLLTSCIPGRVLSSHNIDSLWFRANCTDRYASLVLGLPPSSTDVSFASKKRTDDNTPEDRIGKAYAVCAGRICERNDLLRAGQNVKALTQSIELELEAVVHVMDEMWWRPQGLDVTGSSLSGELMALNLQVRHHILSVMLHLPYISQWETQDSGCQDHSRTMCMHACRAVVHRFLRFRNVYKSNTTGRQIDYAALLSCTTLLQAHMMRRQDSDYSLQPADEDLVDNARQRMEEIAALNGGDTLSTESAKTISELLASLRSFEVSDTNVDMDALSPELDLAWFNLQPGFFDSLDPSNLFASQAFQYS